MSDWQDVILFTLGMLIFGFVLCFGMFMIQDNAQHARIHIEHLCNQYGRCPKPK